MAAAKPYTCCQPIVRRQPRSKERCYRRAAVARTGNAHGQPLVLPGEPSGTERERHAKAGSCNAQQNAHGQHVVESVNEEKTVQQSDDDGRHLNDGGILSADVLREDAQRKAHECAGQCGDRDHEADLRRAQMKGLGNERAHGAVQHPDRKTEVEVKKCGDQRRRVTRLQK